MGDNWDDSDDDWDKDDDDDELDRRLGLKTDNKEDIPNFDDEKDLAVAEKAEQEKARNADLKKKGNALAAKKREEQERLEELELARKTMEMEAEAESKLSVSEQREMQKQRIEDADHALTDDLFGGVDNKVGRGAAGGAAAGDRVILKDMKDHLKHARKVSESMKSHGKMHLVSAFFKEALQQSKDLMDEDGIAELIKSLNVIKNEKMQAAKRKVKGQAQKSKKTDKAAVAKARQIQVDTFGDNDQYDQYDTYGEDYEDAFF